MRLAAVNAAGNLLHPDPAKRGDAQARLRAAVELAVALGVTRVVTMSGCPSGPGGGSLGVFPCWATSCDDERLFAWQLEHEVGPFWRSTSDWLAKEAPDVMICLEMHPGVTIFNVAGFEALAAAVGPNIGINFDPSHFWWQGIDPVTVIDALGSRIGWAHGKDTMLYPERIRRQGVLAFRAAHRSRRCPLALCVRGRRPRRRDLDCPAPRPPRSRLRRRDLDRARGSPLRRRGGHAALHGGPPARVRAARWQAVTTLIDVARRAGVSKSTVSNVIRGATLVADTTRRRVERAIAETGYHPNAIARSLKARASMAIGIVVPDLHQPFLHGAGSRGRRNRQHPWLRRLCRPHGVLAADRRARLGVRFIERRVDGVIIGGISLGSSLPWLLLDRDIPVVLASLGEPADPRLGVIDQDDPTAMEAIIGHLHELGHRRLAFVSHQLREHSGDAAALRL